MPGAGAAVAAAGGAVVAWAVASLVLGGLAAGVMLASGARRPVAAPTELPFGPVLLATFWTVALSW